MDTDTNLISHTMQKTKGDVTKYFDMTLWKMPENDIWNITTAKYSTTAPTPIHAETSYANIDIATRNYIELYESKTGNIYSDTHPQNKPNKFHIITTHVQNPINTPTHDYNSEVAKFINIITDEKIITSTLYKIGINLSLFPIEKINRQRIVKAKEVIYEIKELIASDANTDDKSEEFYRYLPYRKMPTIATQDAADKILDNIEIIQNIYDTYTSIIKNTKKVSITPKHITAYNALNSTVLTYIPQSTEQFVEVIGKNGGITDVLKQHNVNMANVSLFSVCNEAQNNVYRVATKGLRTLSVFHGSILYNWFSILKNGFYLDATRIGAKINGKALGNGIYFSDVFQYSYSYSIADPHQKYVVISLCEIAFDDTTKGTSPVFAIFNTSYYMIKYLLLIEKGSVPIVTEG